MSGLVPASCDLHCSKYLLQNHLTKKGTAYVVNGASGAQYDITVSADGKTLQATNNAVTKA